MADSANYITNVQFLNQLDEDIKTQLTAYAGTDEDADPDTVLTEALFVASRRMDGWLCSRYSTPIDPADSPLSIEILRAYIGPIAIKVLFERKVVTRYDEMNPEYEAALTWLKAVGQSKGASLPDAQPRPVPTTVPDAVKAVHGSAPPVFDCDAGRGV